MYQKTGIYNIEIFAIDYSYHYTLLNKMTGGHY